MIEWNMLSTDLKVCYYIYKFNDIEGKKIWFSKLVETFNDASRSTISKSIDKLFDLGMIDGKWEKAEGKWTRVFKISGEAKDFVKTMYENTTPPSN